MTTTPEPKSYPQTFFQPPPGACQIVLVRHGQSAPFVEGTPFPLVDGQGDPPLSPLGRFQAERVAERLRDEPIDAVYASSLQRTVQTVSPLSALLGLDIAIEADLREVHLGEGEGGRFRQMAAEGHPATVRMRERREWGEIPGAETNEIFTRRTVGAIEAITSRHPDQLVVVACHGGVVGALLGHATGTDAFTFAGCRNGAISMLVVDPAGPWVVRSFNDAAHTGPLTADAEPPT
ncbi:MAG: histidine phosphatase family protein [Acidimicrobiales bacterium]